MKFIFIATLSMSSIFAAQTASVPSNADIQSYAIGQVERAGFPQTETTNRKDFDFIIDNVAEFESLKPSSADNLWSENFETAYVLMEVNRNPRFIEQSVEILRYPSSKSESFQEQPTSTPNQYEKMRIQIKTPSTIVPEDKTDSEDDDQSSKNLANTISNPLPEEFPTSSDQTQKFIEYLKDAQQDPTIRQQKHKIYSRKNPNLVTTLDQDQLSKSIHQNQSDIVPEIEQNIIDDVTRYVAERMTNVIEDEIEPQLEISNRPSLDHPHTIPIQTVDYSIPGIDEKLIEGLQGSVDQIWQGADYYVRFKRNSSEGDIELWWRKGTDDIYLHSFSNRAVDQNWSFGNVRIGLFRDEDRNQIQLWVFGDTILEYIANKDDQSPLRVWENGNENETSYWKYRNLIKSWCSANDFFVGKESCIIY